MSSIREFPKAFLYIKRQQGWRATLEMVGQFVIEPFYESHNGYILRRSLLDPIIVPKADIEMDIREVRVEDVSIMNTIMPNLRVRRLEKKLQAGEICFAGVREGNVIAYVLAGFTDTPSTRSAHLRLDPDESYLWAGYALPQYRRQKVVKVVNLSLCKSLQEKGYKKVVLLVEKSNQASLGHCIKMDYRITDEIIYLRKLNRVSCQINPVEVNEDLFRTNHSG